MYVNETLHSGVILRELHPMIGVVYWYQYVYTAGT
jgi:hypothetical protein